MFVIVWDLPVPGGPYNTNDFPSAEYRTAVSCEESALTGQYSSPGFRCFAISSGGNTSMPSLNLPPALMR